MDKFCQKKIFMRSNYAKKVIFFLLLIIISVPYIAYAQNFESKSLIRMYDLQRIIISRSNIPLDFANAIAKTSKDNNTKTNIALSSIIVSSCIKHIATITSFVTGIMVLCESDKKDINTNLALDLLNVYRNGPLKHTYKYIYTVLKKSSQTFPEPLATIAKDTLRDFNECKDLIDSYGI